MLVTSVANQVRGIKLAFQLVFKYSTQSQQIHLYSQSHFLNICLNRQHAIKTDSHAVVH